MKHNHFTSHICIILALIFSLAGCADSSKSKETPTNKSAEEKSAVKSISADWPGYDAQGIVDTATDIFYGTVESISFANIDVSELDEQFTSGKKFKSIYKISVDKTIKGDSKKEIVLYTPYTMPGYREDEQRELLKETHPDLPDDGFVQIAGDQFTAAEGERYLFCTVERIKDYHVILNPISSALEPNSSLAKEVVSLCK